jgi:two-component system chemotaxis response regulator CheY
MTARVLVVEDDESMRELLRLHLSGAGYDVTAAEDGIAAGYAVLKATPDLIICDVEMPNMDGLQFIGALRADRALPRMPVIFLTSAAEADVRARELGACAFLTKPVLADWLLTAVRQALDGK